MDWDAKDPDDRRTEPPARPPQKAPSTRVEAILDGAARAFSRNGYAAASMRTIAQESDASLGSIYYHFENKEDILRALICDNFSRVHESLLVRLDGVGDPEEALAAFIDNHVSFFANHLDQMRVMSHELDTLTGEAGREVAALRRRYFEEALELMARVRPDLPRAEIRIHALCLFGMLNWTYRWFHTVDPSVGSHGIAQRLTELFLRGFRPAEARPL